MDRRTLLSALAGTGATATAGCLGSLPLVGGDGKDPVLVRAMRAEGDETTYRCSLDRSFVEEYPALRRAIDRARDKPVGEWARTDVSRDRGEAIVAALESHCDVSGGLYLYRGAFFVSVIPRKFPTDGHDHGGHGHSNHSHG